MLHSSFHILLFLPLIFWTELSCLKSNYQFLPMQFCSKICSLYGTWSTDDFQPSWANQRNLKSNRELSQQASSVPTRGLKFKKMPFQMSSHPFFKYIQVRSRLHPHTKHIPGNNRWFTEGSGSTVEEHVIGSGLFQKAKLVVTNSVFSSSEIHKLVSNDKR